MSQLGAQLDRAERYSQDREGRRIQRADRHAIGYTIVPVRPTPPHALSKGIDATTSAEEHLLREGLRSRILESLTPLEAAVLRLQGKLAHQVEERLRIPAGHIAEYIRGGYTYVPGSERDESRQGLPPIATIEVVGRVEVQVEGLNYAAIAERLGVSVRQVHRAVYRANRKVRDLR